MRTRSRIVRACAITAVMLSGLLIHDLLVWAKLYLVWAGPLSASIMAAIVILVIAKMPNRNPKVDVTAFVVTTAMLLVGLGIYYVMKESLVGR